MRRSVRSDLAGCDRGLGLSVEHLKVSLGAAGVSWSASVDLLTGVCEGSYRRDGEERRVSFRFGRAPLKRLRTLAGARFAEGNLEHRDQFASAGVEIVVRSGGRTVTARYHIEGDLPGDSLYGVVRRGLFNALPD